MAREGEFREGVFHTSLCSLKDINFSISTNFLLKLFSTRLVINIGSIQLSSSINVSIKRDF